MTTRVRRRVARVPTVATEWQRDRAFETRRSIATGLGVRPPDWWEYESARPDLADGAGLDAYAHFRPDLMPGAIERLRYLRDAHELADTEWDAIATRSGPAQAWRADLLDLP